MAHITTARAFHVESSTAYPHVRHGDRASSIARIGVLCATAARSRSRRSSARGRSAAVSRSREAWHRRARCQGRAIAPTDHRSRGCRACRPEFGRLGGLAVVSHGAAARLYVATDSTTLPQSSPWREASVAVGSPRASRQPSTPRHRLPKSDVRRVDGFRSPLRTHDRRSRAGRHRSEAPRSSDRLVDPPAADDPGSHCERVTACRGTSRWGVAQLDTLVLTSGGHSVLERQFLTLVNRSGLPMPEAAGRSP